jgi:hypothetical protein
MEFASRTGLDDPAKRENSYITGSTFDFGDVCTVNAHGSRR